MHDIEYVPRGTEEYKSLVQHMIDERKKALLNAEEDIALLETYL